MKMKNHQKGAAMVEFALVLPLFVVLVFGIIECGLMLYDKAILTNASREAARSGIALKNPKMTTAEIQAVATAYCQNLISFGSSTCTFNPPPTGVGGNFGTPLTVTVSYPYQTLVIGALLNGSFSNTVTLTATTTMNNE